MADNMTISVGSHTLSITEKVPVDESIVSYEYREYESTNPAALNSGQAIDITILTQDVYTQPSKSFLLIEGTLTSATNDAYGAAALVALINNGIPYMFSQIRYKINGTEIENVASPGQATTMKGMLAYGDDFSKSEGLNMCWQKDTTAAAAAANLGFEARRQLIIARPDPVGTFSFVIPLRHLFGFCDDYVKVIYGTKQSLQLSRQGDADAIFRAAAARNGRITLNKLSWFMPHVRPSVEYTNSLIKEIENKARVPVAFRAMQCDSLAVPQATTFSWPLSSKSEKPRWIILGFQTGKDGDQRQNPALFDHVQVRNVHALLNSDRYPEYDWHLNFTQQTISLAFRAVCEFKDAYYGIGPQESSNQITRSDFVDFFPLFVLDVRRQSERLKNSVQNITLKVEFDAAVPANTMAYALVISDRLLYLDSDGSKFGVAWK